MQNNANINNINREDKMDKIKEILSITIVALAFLLITGAAKADSYKHIKGTVTSVEAKYGTNNVHTPQEVCSVKEVPIYSQSTEPNIVGAIIGGYLGSKIGGGKGNEPLVMNDNGRPYRAFLEGKISGNSYCLIMHLSNQEYKTVV